MSYEKSLEAAGAEVLAFSQFGSYQGDWWAKVRYEGREAWVSGSYGSCSGCDSFEAEFGYGEENCEEHKYDDVAAKDCQDCKKAKVAYEKKLADFGRSYLDGLMTQEEAEKRASANIEWDTDADEMLAWLKASPLAT